MEKKIMRLIDIEAPCKIEIELDGEKCHATIIAHTVDAIPIKHGEWAKTGQSFVYPNRFRNYCCSVCGYDIEKTKYNYCPNCGAKMDGRKVDDLS